MVSLVSHKAIEHADLFLKNAVEQLGMALDDLQYFPEVSPYLILDGHRTGIADSDGNPARGYIEGAIFSLRFAQVLKDFGGTKATFLIHTLRNYKTMDRMHAIFDAVENVSKQFIETTYRSGIHLRYFGKGVHDEYALADLINAAEKMTKDCDEFDLNYITNYSEVWGMENVKEIVDIPDISVIGRFTKGHYSGANIPGHTNQANFIYIQQASISENWSDEEMIMLALSILKSHLSLKGFVGGKSYGDGELNEIREAREELMWEEKYTTNEFATKRIISYNPKGPITILF
ncbi:MAG: hypothetical protein ACW98K_01465 [Candidatus Kariarchaeaceae archaeon]|jgi:hypothetical protein